jgi:Domain of unknown function (DUF4340)
MKPKSALVILLVVVALVAGIAVYELKIKPSKKEDEKKSESLFPGFDVKSAERIEIVNGSTIDVFVHSGATVWKMEKKGHVINSNFMDDINNSMPSLKNNNVVSKSKESHKRLKVEDESGVLVKFFSGGDEKVKFVFGKHGKGSGTTFLRIPGEDTVYLVYQNLKNQFVKEKNDWRDKAIFSSDEDKISSVKISTPIQTETAQGGTESAPALDVVVLQKDGESGDWTAFNEDGSTLDAFDSNKLRRAVNSVARLRSDEFADDVSPEDAGISDTSMKVEFTETGGASYTLLVGKFEDSEYFVKRSDIDAIHKVSDYRIKNIFFKMDGEEETDTGSMPFDPGQMLPVPDLNK